MKIALITGGSKGLGESLVKKYQDNNYQTLEFSRSGISENNIKCDLSDQKAFPDVFNRALIDVKKLNPSEILLINNAGTIDPIGPISEFNTEDWVNHININFTSVVITTGLFIKHFQTVACTKSIGFISSGAALRPKYGWSLYCASKAGIEQFCITVSIEQQSQANPIYCAIIDPDIIDTEMQFKIRETQETLFPESQRFKSFKNDGLLRGPDSVADIVFTILSNPIDSTHRHSIDEI